ncbi:MAG: aspartate aminotransferase family protein [Actinomycetia bacterium]|nr:aspartate aminotransferase family protein [Actinomycetes bacterium]MCP4958676.1 aspartate aminotransferase family protein [Actinomycetes bacterium]
MSALLHPFANPAKAEDNFISVVKAERSTLWDSNGKSYIDGLASLWYCQVGHGRREIIDAVHQQMLEFESYHIFDPFTHEPARQVADAIVSKTPMPEGRVFLASSGSEAVDTALKIIRLHGQRRGGSGGAKQIIIRREHGYHGTNFGGTTAQGIASNREGWGDLIPHFVQVPSNDLEAVASLFAEKGDQIAGIISEPIQGAGGVIPPADGYLEGLRRLCDDHDALLCFDEVIAGFGRTGSWFGSQTWGVKPDLFTFAKGVTSGYQPLSGVVISEDIASDLEQMDEVLRHGYTYSGHAAACVAGIKNIEIIESEGLVERANTQLHSWFRDGLSALVADGVIESYRGQGAIWGADLGRDSVPVRDAMLEAGVVVRGIGNVMAFCPPLIITEGEVTQMLDTLVASL